MQFRILGRTGLKVSEIGFGAWAMGGGWSIAGTGIGYGGTDDESSKAALRKALDLGVNFIDTADAYGAGHSETLIGEVMKNRWRDCFIATKVGNERRDPLPGRKNLDPDYIRRACENSLRRLRKETIDVYQLHGPNEQFPATDEVFAVLQELRIAGKIRFIGVSVNQVLQANQYIEQDQVDVIQLHYSILDRQAERGVLNLAAKHEIGIIARVPLSSGLLAGKFSKDTVFDESDHRHNWLTGEKLVTGVEQVEVLRPIAKSLNINMTELALRFVLQSNNVHTTIPGAKNQKQAESNCLASDGVKLPTEVMDKIRKVVLGDFGNPT